MLRFRFLSGKAQTVFLANRRVTKSVQLQNSRVRFVFVQPQAISRLKYLVDVPANHLGEFLRRQIIRIGAKRHLDLFGDNFQ